MTNLIADSGSTKTNWLLMSNNGSTRLFHTEGINPVVGDEETIERTISASFTPQVDNTEIDNIYFYGAGCTAQKKSIVAKSLKNSFPKAHIEVESDVLAAARALCGHEEGIACILGTGSNSCLYDGHDIVENVSPLGYILGDEGSGAILGKSLISDILKHQLPKEICDDFFDKTGLSEEDIIDHVYKKPMPNRFMASFVPFIYEHHRDSQIAELLVINFRNFIRRNVMQYKRYDLPLNFIGGIAHSFHEEIKVAVEIEHLIMGCVELEPLNGLVRYYTTLPQDEII